MSDYAEINWFKTPLVWFLIFTCLSSFTITIYVPHAYAAQSATVLVAQPVIAVPHNSLAIPQRVELPVSTRATQTIVTEPHKPKAPPPVVEHAPAGIESVIQFALAQLGKPYRWGAAGPSSYDCSGLVMAAFSKIGIQLPHYTRALIGYGKAVSRSGLQRGDIVFPSGHHVAIYLGNGQMIHAPQPGEVVKISSVYAFYAARRLV